MSINLIMVIRGMYVVTVNLSTYKNCTYLKIFNSSNYMLCFGGVVGNPPLFLTFCSPKIVFFFTNTCKQSQSSCLGVQTLIIVVCQ